MASKKKAPVDQLQRSVQARRQNGSKGGIATLKKHGLEFAAERAAKGGAAVLEKYGREYYSFLARRPGKQRKGWPKGKLRKPLAEQVLAPILQPQAMVL